MLLTAALISLFCYSDHSAAIAERNALEYHIAIDNHLRRLNIELCVGDRNFPATLVAAADLAKNISDIKTRQADGSSIKLQNQDQTIEIANKTIECVSYTVKIHADQSNRRSGLVAHNGAIVIALEQILLRPGSYDRWGQTLLNFTAPPSVKVSAPGSALPSAAGIQSFELLDRPIDWDGSVAFGQLTQSSIELGGTKVALSVVGHTRPETASAVNDWLVAGVAAITTLYGSFPVARLQVLVFPVGRDSDPVPWGEVKRGGGDAVHLYVDATRVAAELHANWVLSHELSHLIHPYISGADAWLPEGIASYYQNVLRARSSLIDAQTAWKKLDAGIQRGLAQFTRGRTLALDTRKMMQEYQYMRVYWSGAAIALIGDVELRKRSGGAMSLDLVFKGLSRCCLPSMRQWSAAQLMTKMDEIAAQDVFMPLYRRFVMRPEFPDVKAAYRHLGLNSDGDELRFSKDATVTALRNDIMGQR